MPFTTRRGATVLAACAVVAGGAGAAIAGGSPLFGGSGDRADGLAEALNESAGTNVTGEQVEQALENLREERVQEAIDSGRITQEQADARAAHQEGRDALRAASETALSEFLDSSIDEIREGVEAGTSIAAQAEAAGKTRDGAVAALVEAITAARDSAPEEAQERLTDERIQQMAERTVDADELRGRGGRRGGGHHGRGFGGGDRQGGGPGDSAPAPEADGPTTG